MTIVAKGTYRARAKADGAQFGVTTKKGTDFVRVPFEITEGIEKGNSVSWDGWFTEKTNARTIESLRTAGCTFPNNDITDLTGLGSAEVSIVVEHESYQKEGEPEPIIYARVAWVNALSGGVNPDAKMDDAHRASFRERMKGAVMVVKSDGGTNGSAQTTQSAPTGGARIPF